MEGVFEKFKIGIIQALQREMRIAFIQNFLGQHFGIMYISAVLKKHNHTAEVFIEGLEKDFIKSLCESRPDVVGFTLITGEQRWVENRAHQIKKVLGVPIIVGGPHPTYFPEMIDKDNIDIVCRGEGEFAVLELLNRLEQQKGYNDILNLWIKKNGRIYKNELRPLLADIDSLPFPDRDIYKKYSFIDQSTELPASFSRGCPYDCTFCYNAVKKKMYNCSSGYVRLRSVTNAIIELKQSLNTRKRVKSVIIVDDDIALDKEWLNEFCRTYKNEINLPFFASVRADFIVEDNVKKLKKANCYCLAMGVETGNYQIRKNILGKDITNEKYIKAANLIKKYGISLKTSNMFFLPGETVKNSFETLKLNIRMRSDYPWAYILQPYPGTAIYDYAVKNGYLKYEFSFNDLDPLGLIKSPLKLKDERKILIMQRLFYYGVKVPGVKFFLRALIYVPNNLFFDLLHQLAILISYASYHRVSLFRALRVALDAKSKCKQSKKEKVSL